MMTREEMKLRLIALNQSLIPFGIMVNELKRKKKDEEAKIVTTVIGNIQKEVGELNKVFENETKALNKLLEDEKAKK